MRQMWSCLEDDIEIDRVAQTDMMYVTYCGEWALTILEE